MTSLVNPMRWPPAVTRLGLAAVTVALFGAGFAVGWILPLP
jgi:hypothetical protein